MAEFDEVLQRRKQRQLQRRDDLRAVEPHAEDERVATEKALESLRPKTVLENVGSPQAGPAARRSFEDVLAGRLVKPPVPPERGPMTEGERVASLALASLTVGAVTQNHSLTARAITQFGAMGATEYGLRRMDGMDRKEAFLHGLGEGGIAAGAEAALPLALKTGGKIVHLTRDSIRALRAKSRVARNLRPMPSIRRVDSYNAPFAQHLEPGGAEATEVVSELGEVLTPGKPVRHRFLDSLQNIADSSLTAGQRMSEVSQAAERATAAHLDDIVEALPSMPRGRIAATLEALWDGRLQKIKGIAHSKYRYVDEQLAPKYKTVTTRTEEVVNDPKATLRPKVEQRVETRKLLVGNGVDISDLKKDVAEGVDRFSKGIIEERVNRVRRILDKPDVVDYATGQQIRSDLYEISGQFNPDADPVLKADKALAQRMSGKLTNSIQRAARQAPPEVKEALDEANRLWREEVKGTLTSKMMVKWVKGQGEDMLDALIRTGKPGQIRMVREFVMKEDPEAWKLVQSSFLRRIMHATKNEFGEVQGEHVMKLLNSFGREDMAALNELFPGKEAGQVMRNFKRAANAHMFTQRQASRAGGGGGTIWFQMAQAGAFFAVAGGVGSVGALVTGHETLSGVLGTIGVGGLMIALAPGAISHVLTNPELSRWLSVGAMHGPGSRHGARATIVVLGTLLKDNLIAEESVEQARELIGSFRAQLRDSKGSKLTPKLDARMSAEDQRKLREMELNTNPEMRATTNRTALP